ncbi:hypothetical protein [Providencia sneebia]|uniref:Lipoprotein n=1 Tax=Providencia sneebia DSM 19967 TaxID=1141660 RepID=K8W5A1_9GAMM|nr:hypothetical protein [Providencia sneebia]EKT55768.1 hypothetical protein OO7_12364 [Providencia sneebia DSM 19967]
MKKGLFLVIWVILLSGCGGKDVTYNGEYVCIIDRDINRGAGLTGSEYEFPGNLSEAVIMIENRVVTVKGMNIGDYVTPRLEEKKGKEGDELFYDKDDIHIGYMKRLGILSFRLPDGSGQVLTSCKSK